MIRRSRLLRPAPAAALLAFALLSMAHVGSPDTFFAGTAGPYAVRVSVRLPGVIPGRAQVAVRVVGATAGTAHRVTLRAALWTTGLEGAPPAETGVPVPGDPELYASELWFMAPSSYRLYVTIDGSEGQGTVIVPVMALATAQRTMGTGLGLLLVGLGLFLTVGFLTIVGTAVRESGLPAGAVPDDRRRRRARVAVAVTGIGLAAIGWGGSRWWDVEAFSYGRFVLYRPFASEAVVQTRENRRILSLGIRDERWPQTPNPASRYNALLPDHGKLMHLFLVREPALDAFAHLHPIARTPAAHDFDVEIPPVPPGRYRVYGDIVHESGYAQTLTTMVEMPPILPSRSGGDADDSWTEGPATPAGATPAAFRFPDGRAIVWTRGDTPLRAGEERLLEFAAVDAAGAPLAIEPYMGMLGHAAVSTDDGAVFAHLHPAGSVSMAALQRFSADKDGAAASPHHAGDAAAVLRIPFAFPKAGAYRVWVQMKHDGRILTASFQATVNPPGGTP